MMNNWVISDEIRKSFDLSQNANLEYLRFECLKPSYSTRYRNRLENAAIILASLPKSSNKITINLRFSVIWGEGDQTIARIDQILAANDAVTSVEVIPFHSKEKEAITREFSRLSSKEVLWVGPKSQARQAF